MIGRVLGRFDMAVAVFFALSGYLLWRSHAAAARGLAAQPSTIRYLCNRAARILPAYWVVVVVVLAFLPEAGGGLRVWLANLGLVQVFVPLTLTNGMTQMWSLSVEVAFYLVLPVVAFGMVWLRGPRAKFRVPVLLTVAVVALGWGFIPIPTPDGIHSDNWLPGYLPWFAAGMVVAELGVGAGPRIVRFAQHQRVLLVIAAVAFALSATNLAGPEGLTRAQPWQFAVKIGLGAVLGFALIAPIAFSEREGHRFLGHPVMLALGRWSYGIFIWHLAVLSIVFPVFGVVPFRGSFIFVLVVTVVLTIPVASASYALVEEPVRRAVKRWEIRRNIGGRPAITDNPSATTATSAGS